MNDKETIGEIYDRTVESYIYNVKSAVDGKQRGDKMLRKTALRNIKVWEQRLLLLDKRLHELGED